MNGLERGVRVYSKDGKYLGDISDFRGSDFKLDAPMAVDFWLPVGDVEKVEHGSALLSFDEANLPDHRIESGAAPLEPS